MVDYQSLVNEIWSNLVVYDLKRNLIDMNELLSKKYTLSYQVFNFNIMRALLPLHMKFIKLFKESVIDIETNQYYPQFPKELVIILFVTSLEVYLRNLFLDLMYYTRILDLNQEYLNEFLKQFKLKNKDSDSILRDHFEKERLEFQRSDICKLAFKSININLPEIIDKVDKDLWRKMFSSEPEKLGYIKIRNNLIHKGIVYVLNKFPKIEVNLVKITDDIAKFVYIIEKEIITKYSKSNFVRLYHR